MDYHWQSTGSLAMFYRATIFVLAGIALCGCASTPSDVKGFRQSELSSPRYQVGYNDGCEGANLNYAQSKMAGGRNEQLFRTDDAYREGWMTGRENCKDTVFTVSSGKPNDHLML
jgi:hypothetical protein